MQLNYYNYDALKVGENSRVSSPTSKEIKDTATYILEKSGQPDFMEFFSAFATNLCSQLKYCLSRKRSLKLEKEAMRGNFHMLRSPAAAFKDCRIPLFSRNLSIYLILYSIRKCLIIL